MYTFGQLKKDIRPLAFPEGEDESLVAPHNKSFEDALQDLQQWVECLRTDNVTVYPHCSTYYRCGLTNFPMPDGIIKKVSVIAKINPDTGQEDLDAEDDWCSEIVYHEVDAAYIELYIQKSTSYGCCMPAAFFFGIPTNCCSKGAYKVPTDEGVPDGLPPLPLGYHYPQASTDATRRATAGVWAKYRGSIYIAPWIQQSESVVVVWDGIKARWNDFDPVINNAKVARAVQYYVRREHWSDWEHDPEQAKIDDGKFATARQDLIHLCRQKNRRRFEGHPSESMSAAATTHPELHTTSLYFNDFVSFTASCPEGMDGDPVTVKIPAGTISSAYSKDHATQLAKQQAQAQAEAKLNCTESTLYWNTEVKRTASCQAYNDAPVPTGQPVTEIVPAGTVSSTVSVASANAAAAALALQRAQDKLVCTYWNRAVTRTASCPEGTTGDDESYTVPQRTYSSTLSQDDADQKASVEAQRQAELLLDCDEAGPPTQYTNESVSGTVGVAVYCTGDCYCSFTIRYTVAAGLFTSVTSQYEANAVARDYAVNYAQSPGYAIQMCGQHIDQCIQFGGGGYSVPGNPTRQCSATVLLNIDSL